MGQNKNKLLPAIIFFTAVILGTASFGFVATTSALSAQVQSPDWVSQLLEGLRKLVKEQPTPPASAPEVVYRESATEGYAPAHDYEQAVTAAVKRNDPAVVSIIISKDVPVFEQRFINPLEGFDLPPEFRDFFQFEFQVPEVRQKGIEKREIGGGSGFIISSDGFIVTNRHVIAEQDASYTVFLNDGRKFEGRVIALHPVDDLGVLKIDASGLPTVTLGNSDSIKLGQTAIAIGNALGEFRNTVSVGVVSGLRRNLTARDSQGSVVQLEDLMQTDAAINLGNSGGPLVNLRGEVIGVNTAIVSGAQNIGFSIPINRVKRMLQDVKRYGQVKVPYLGVRYVSVTDQVKKEFNLPVDYGALILKTAEEDGDVQSAIVPGSPAAKAGLVEKDVILEFNRKKITLQYSLAFAVSQARVGDRVSLKILRDGKEMTVAVMLEERPKNL